MRDGAGGAVSQPVIRPSPALTVSVWPGRLEAKEQGHGDRWTDLVPPLTSFGPGVLHVDDPDGSARRHIGCSVDHGPLLASWEHRSEVGRVLFAAKAGALTGREATSVEAGVTTGAGTSREDGGP